MHSILGDDPERTTQDLENGIIADILGGEHETFIYQDIHFQPSTGALTFHCANTRDVYFRKKTMTSLYDLGVRSIRIARAGNQNFHVSPSSPIVQWTITLDSAMDHPEFIFMRDWDDDSDTNLLQGWNIEMGVNGTIRLLTRKLVISHCHLVAGYLKIMGDMSEIHLDGPGNRFKIKHLTLLSDGYGGTFKICTSLVRNMVNMGALEIDTTGELFLPDGSNPEELSILTQDLSIFEELGMKKNQWDIRSLEYISLGHKLTYNNYLTLYDSRNIDLFDPLPVYSHTRFLFREPGWKGGIDRTKCW